MKRTRYREHTIDVPVKYEGHKIGATVTFDDEVDELPPGYIKGPAGIYEFLEDELDEMLALAVTRAVKSGVVEDSHVRSYYGL